MIIRYFSKKILHEFLPFSKPINLFYLNTLATPAEHYKSREFLAIPVICMMCEWM